MLWIPAVLAAALAGDCFGHGAHRMRDHLLSPATDKELEELVRDWEAKNAPKDGGAPRMPCSAHLDIARYDRFAAEPGLLPREDIEDLVHGACVGVGRCAPAAAAAFRPGLTLAGLGLDAGAAGMVFVNTLKHYVEGHGERHEGYPRRSMVEYGELLDGSWSFAALTDWLLATQSLAAREPPRPLPRPPAAGRRAVRPGWLPRLAPEADIWD